MTGAFLSQPFGGQAQMQHMGLPPSLPFQFAQPFQPTQPSSSQANNFTIEPQRAPQHRPFSTFIPQQTTGWQSGLTTGFLQPQPTGANPFRQSMFVPQMTGMPTLSSNGISPMPPSAPQTEPFFQMTSNLQSQPPGQPKAIQQPVEAPARPASTPLTTVVANSSSVSPPIAQPVKSHQTGSRNPFGVPVTPAPPVPKPPTLFELSMLRPGVDGSQSTPQSQSTAATGHQVQSTVTTTESTFSTVASSFAFTNKFEENTSSLSNDSNHLGSRPLNSQTTPTAPSSSAPDSLFSSLSSQPTNATISLHAPSTAVTGPIQAQPTGFGGVKPFKPSSNFGASLLGSLPPIPQSGATTPDPNAQITTALGTINPHPTGFPLPSQRTNGGPTLGVGLRPQATGALGAANPFRATMFATTSPPSAVSTASGTLASSASTPQFGGLGSGAGALPVFGSAFGNGAFNTQQQNTGVSLI